MLAPLLDLVNWLTPTSAENKTVPALEEKSVLGFKFHRAAHPRYLSHSESMNATSATAQRPLRIVRILEADHLPANVGRMVISGRMSDVCAELDRLAAREAALH